MGRLPISEAAFTETVIQLAKWHGWRVAHFRPAQTSRGWRTPMSGDVGFPDLVLARKGEVLFAELKSETGRMRREQVDWAAELPGVHIWRPSNLEHINELLR